MKSGMKIYGFLYLIFLFQVLFNVGSTAVALQRYCVSKAAVANVQTLQNSVKLPPAITRGSKPPLTVQLFPLMGVVWLVSGFLFWLLAIAHVATNRSLQTQEKILWLLVVAIFSLVGAIVYFFVAPSPKRALTSQG